MTITGENIIGFKTSKENQDTFPGTTAGQSNDLFHPATGAELNEAMEKAKTAFQTYRHFPASKKAAFLNAIADEIEASGSTLIETAVRESGLPEGRITGERGRTCGQLRLFARYIEEGSWVEAVIDRGNPDRQPLPKPDIRKMLVPLGPVVVFTASNFPLAFSTAGGDTASALAAGCPVVVKSHEAHPATNEWVALAIQRAARKTGMPDGVFSSLNGGHELGQALVQHSLTSAVAFTGSHRGGKALFDLANSRPVPIPVFAEMGSVNPVFILPEMISKKAEVLAGQLAGSVSLGAGQFCTNPGLIFVPESSAGIFTDKLAQALSETSAQCMLNSRIFNGYHQSLEQLLAKHKIELICKGGSQEGNLIQPAAGKVQAEDFLKNPGMQTEVFGPFSLVVIYRQTSDLQAVAKALQGQLTISVFGLEQELVQNLPLLNELQQAAGRLIVNNVPTGVEVCHAMQHGGPYPATTDSRFTSVGTAAIRRFVRPVAFQGFPGACLPAALQDGNPLNIWRLEDGEFIK